MTADLKHLNCPHPLVLSEEQFSKKLVKTISRLYFFTLLTVSIGTCFALYQDWNMRMNDAKSHLVRSAKMGNLLVETALASAEKSLETTQSTFTKALQSGPVDRLLANQLLNMCYSKFTTYNKADVFGLLFFVDAQGFLYAKNGNMTNEKIDFSDRFYFYELRDHSEIKRTVGPLVFARTTNQWVFHMSVPVQDRDGKFAGVLVQQISVADISKKLLEYVDTSNFEQMVTHLVGNDASFVFPPPGAAQSPKKEFLQAIKSQSTPLETGGGIFNWNGGKHGLSDHMLIGVAKSPAYSLETYVTFPSSKVRHEFWLGNMYFLSYMFLGFIFSTAIFYYLHNLSKQLVNAQVASLYDALTHIHNRRALDETLPVLLRESMRSQEPLSVLFIDIDHFRFFNENYGHESGDIALKAVAQVIASCASRPLDFVCRWGGEEFVVVLPKTNRLAAMQIAQEILLKVREIQLQSNDGQQPRITVSVGHATSVITSIPTQEDLVDEADKAMLKAKSQGRNQCVEYVAND